MHAGLLHVITPIMIGGERIGTMIIGDDMFRSKTAMKKDGFFLLFVMLLAIGIAYLLTTRLQGLICRADTLPFADCEPHITGEELMPCARKSRAAMKQAS